MKQTILLLMVLILTVSVSPVSAAPAPQKLSAPDQLAYIDAQVEVFTSRLAEYQAGYLAKNKGFCQALESHAAPPELLAEPDGLLSHPTDQSTPLEALWLDTSLPAEIGWSFRVDTYDGPDGPGYVVVIKTVIEDTVYIREQNYGPEKYRTQPWYAMSEEF